MAYEQYHNVMGVTMVSSVIPPAETVVWSWLGNGSQPSDFNPFNTTVTVVNGSDMRVTKDVAAGNPATCYRFQPALNPGSYLLEMIALDFNSTGSETFRMAIREDTSGTTIAGGGGFNIVASTTNVLSFTVVTSDTHRCGLVDQPQVVELNNWFEFVDWRIIQL